MPKGLIRAETYINEGNSIDSTRILCEFGKKKNLSKDEKISYYILKAKLSYIIEKNKDLFEYSTKAYQESLNQENSLQLLDVYIINRELPFCWIVQSVN